MDKRYRSFVCKYNQSSHPQKRKYDEENHTSNKKLKYDDGGDDVDMKTSPEKKNESSKATNLSKKKPKEYITINHLKYPIHPYTIQVSNLPLSTKHNDLLKIFESFNADILYARMLHHKPKRHTKPITFKKALIQFYTTEGCDAIIKYVEEGIDISYEGNVLEVMRSHIPALEKCFAEEEDKKKSYKDGDAGKDKSKVTEKKKESKYNRHKRLDINDMERMKIDGDEDTAGGVEKKEEKRKSKGSIFAFQPRSVKK